MADIARIARRVDAVRRLNAERDARMQEVYDVRSNHLTRVAPGSQPDAWPKSIVANSIDVAAKQLSETLAQMPSINCTSGTMTSDRAKRFAERRTKIAYGYLETSQFRVKMPQGCDWYLSYGFMPIVVEPDFVNRRPLLRFENPMKTYAQLDAHGKVVSYVKIWRETGWQLADRFPEFAARILGEDQGGMRTAASGDSLLECIKWCDADQYVLYMPERQNLVLMETANPLGEVPVALGLKPSYDEQSRGQFDDVPYIQLARQRMALLGLQATQQSVRAPLAIPTDVQRIPLGDDAIIRTNSPEKIRRVGTEMPVAAFQQEQLLGEEIQRAVRMPASATGDVKASIITGRGVEALNSGYDTQIATGQMVIGEAIRQALMIAMRMDEKFWPNEDKTIRGMINGAPFEEAYRPARDLAGDYQVQVSYGFASGLNPNQALIFLLQLRGDQQVSRDFVQRQLPMDINVTQMQAQIDIEQVEDALKQGVFAMLASAGVMAQQGMDPTETLRKAAAIIGLRQKGTPMHQAILDAFAPTAAPPGPPGAPPAPGAPPEPAAPPGQGPGGPAAAQGQAELGPGGRPDVMQLLAGLSSAGGGQVRSSIRRMVPA